MYSECASLTDDIQERAFPRVVLRSYPPAVGREVVRSVLGPLGDLLKSRGEPSEGGVAPASPLQTREEVEWTMEVVGYGLSLPLTDHSLIASCIDVYEDWLTALSLPSPSVPAPILAEPGHYTQVIFSHLYQLFVPRVTPTQLPSVGRDVHFDLCHRVLNITQSVLMKPCSKLSEATWEAISKHLLSVTDTLLSPPLPPSSNLASRLSNQLIHVLFEAWLRACTAFFPAPHLWKSLRELCLRWRHHRCLAGQWSRLMYSLTLQVVVHLYSPRYLDHLQSHLQEDAEFSEILQAVPPDSLVQCWYRMLHTLGNPVELAYVTTFTSLPALQKTGVDPIDHLIPDLPLIFHEAMRGLAQLVYLFLGQEQQREEPRPPSEVSVPPTPPLVRPSSQSLHQKTSRENRSTVSSSGVQKTSSTVWYTPSPKIPPVSQLTPLTSPHSTDIKRPRGNTLLHLFGSWLFEAAALPLHVKWREGGKEDSKRSTVFRSMVDLNASVDSTLTPPPEDLAQFEAGRAEALGALCAVFSSQPCGEPFLPVYLGWFYQCLSLGLQHEETSQGQMMTRILLNSPTLFRKGLPGVNLLLPHFLTALEHVLPHSTPQVRCVVGTQELRHASIQLLLSILSLPLHFLHQPLPAMPNASVRLEGWSGVEGEGGTFYSLREWMLWLLFSAIPHERHAPNMQLLLHGILVSLQDIVLYENAVAKMAEAAEGEGSAAAQKTEFFSSVDKDYGSASLFRRACKVAHWCLLTWESSVHTSLAALELLQGLAQLQFEYIDHVDLKQAVVWVCDYIQHRAEKDHLQHSRDLHTSIVAAFSCLLSWVTLHPYLLGDKSALDAVMQVVELGISGSFSQSPSGTMAYKGEKELKPISGRVKDIAEFVLTCIMEQVGAFPLPCGAESSSSLLNEEHLLARLPVGGKKVDCHFQYFLVDNATIVGLLEAPFSDHAEGVAPSLTAVVRGLSGRHCWHMQLRMKPCSSQGISPKHQTIPRPTPSSPLLPDSFSHEHSPWPEEACDGRALIVDRSIPSLDAVLNGDNREQYETMASLVAQQIEREARSLTESHVTPSQPHKTHPSLEPPHRAQDAIETGRLFLNHLSLLGIETVKQHMQAGQKPSIVTMDHSSQNFKQSLAGLDHLPTRFCSTVFMLHCRDGCHNPEEILAHQSQATLRPPEFSEFIQGLGWMVDPLSHAGFAGKIRPGRPDETGHMLTFGAQIPSQPFPYYADSVMEVAFIQPVLRPSASHSSTSLRSVESSDSGQDAVSTASKSSLPPAVEKEPLCSQTSLPFLQQVGVAQTVEGERCHTLPLRGKQMGSRTDIHSTEPPRRRSAVPQDCAVLVVWLDRFEDHASFPLEDLSEVLHGASFGGVSTSRLALRRVLPCIFIHMLPSGLFQVTTTASRADSLAGPLLEGMVVSRRSLSRLVRLTATNMCGRHRLDNEGYCPPHVKRKRKIEEMASQFSLTAPAAEFYCKLLLRETLTT